MASRNRGRLGDPLVARIAAYLDRKNNGAKSEYLVRNFPDIDEIVLIYSDAGMERGMIEGQIMADVEVDGL